MTYKVELFGRLIEEEWNPIQNSLFDLIKNYTWNKEFINLDLDHLEAIFDSKTGFVKILKKGVK